ncbi:hypothetical protein F5984_18390 [Rudanella paleaurantiibacter]|uniref:NnrS family protein n=1 Tax=Rudanella paleaurantiibacter TaxID=2614655 RepID=A0A7J5TWL2_9BACT|nr:hypothetical protein [Rudanella paleaurantiibacter]KAB7728789.1 hypothetical protein F5984_18390 [Rudanella paleaurantiibacter]
MNVADTPLQGSRTQEQRDWQTALLWWVVAGGLGVLLRYLLLRPSATLVYPYWLHAHSHVVLLGWAFNALFLTLIAQFVSSARQKAYRPIWIGFQVAIVGMLGLFPVQGYGAGSIIFSTLHVLLSYYMAWRLYTDLRPDHSLAARFVRWGLLFLVMSTLGPYALGILKARQLHETIWYNLSIYFYLHFLYNGWFMFGCLALLVRWLERWGCMPVGREANRFLLVWIGATVGTLALSALWTQPPMWVWAVGAVAGLAQLAAGGWLIRLLWQQRSRLQSKLRTPAYWLGQLALLSFGLKLGLQALSASAWATEWSYTQRHLVIAYLHLVFIGVISFFLLAWAIHRRILRPSGPALGLILVFFTLTEGGLVLESILQRTGTYLPYFGEMLLLFSVGLWIGVVWLWRVATAQNKGATSVEVAPG